MAADRIELPEGQEQFKLNEVCKLANVQPYMLRFWGTEFPQLEASKSDTGQRHYSREQVQMIFEIRHLLFDEGLTIAGTRKRLESDDEATATADTAKSRKRPPKKKSKAAAATAKAEATDDKREDEGPKAEPAAPAVEGPAEKSAAMTQEEVDKIASESVKPFLATLRELRSEISDILHELRPEAE